MTYSTEAEKRLNQLRQDVRTCHDPYELAAELAVDNERLRKRIRKCNCHH